MALQQRDDIDRLYMSIKQRRGLASIEEYIDPTIQGLMKYTEKSHESLITPNQ